ncbi:MAG: hypothetical protein ACRD1O_03585 [Terriglobia bacterium]
MQSLPQGIPPIGKSIGSLRPGFEITPLPSVLPAPPQAMNWAATAFPRVAASPSLPPDGRCSEKGCVFPAASGAEGKCLHHHRQAAEPILFSSHQPTRVVLERGRFAIPEREVDTSRNRDRRQLAAIREAFLED